MRRVDRILAAVIGVALIAAGLAAAFGLASLPVDEGALARSNAAYLQTARDAAVADLATLGAIKGVLDIVASARIGFDFLVSADVGVGQGLSALATLVDDAMAAVTLSIAANEALALTLAAAQALTGTLGTAAAFSAGLCLCVAAARMDRLARIFGEIARIFLLGLFAAHVALPYAVQITGWVALGASDIVHGHVGEGLAALHRDIVGQAAGATRFGDWSDKNAVSAAYDHLNHDIVQKIQATASVSWMHYARAAVFGVAFPLLLVVILHFAADRLLRATVASLSRRTEPGA
jgi:hypothetical protein